jgi:hypothetical protein
MNKLEECNQIIENEIASEYQKEAKNIIKFTDDDYRNQFIELAKLGNGNALCLLLDKAKNELVVNKVLDQNEHDGFGLMDIF